MPKLKIHGGALAALLLPVGLWAGPSTQETPPTGSVADTRIATMRVEVWPEYDDPRVLVMYRGTMAADQTLPTDFAFIVPSGAQVHMAGAIDTNGGHVHALFQENDRGDGTKEIFYRLEHPQFYMEFYYDPLTGAEQREFSYPLVSPFPIEDLKVSVQQPLRATGFGVSPPTSDVVQDQQGFSYYVVSSGPVPAGEESSVSVAYRKTDRETSVAGNQAGGEVPQSQSRTMTGILIGAVIILLGVVGYGLFASSRRKRARTGPGRKTAARPASAHTRQAGGRSSRFCSQCGAEIDETDRFCNSCGH
ncbi:MAG: zinc ribbon domain-containing protein, partial [Gemmatimonadota bacterium]